MFGGMTAWLLSMSSKKSATSPFIPAVLIFGGTSVINKAELLAGAGVAFFLSSAFYSFLSSAAFSSFVA